MKLTGISEKVFLDRYSLKDRAGKPTEKKPDDMWKRISKAVAAQEKTPEGKKKWEKEFNDAMKDFKYVPGGRILAGAGTGYEVTFYNCFVIPSPKDAPLFGKVKHKVKKFLKGATFVAHNVWFDYSFIQSEFARIEIPFESKRCCTVRLSRRLYPQYKSHSLAALIERHGFGYKNRHRAYDDAFVLWQFLKKIKKEIPAPLVKSTWKVLAQIP